VPDEILKVTTQCPSCEKWIPKDSKRCPECSTHIGVKRKSAPGSHPEHDTRCAWNINGDRCRYPGTISGSTNGGGPWYCSEHFSVSDVRTGAALVGESVRYLTQTREERAAADLARLNAEAAQYCADHGLDTVAKMREFARTAFQQRKPNTAGTVRGDREESAERRG
jgi:hypothetical protein